jgi:hypothetical protein
MRQRPPMGAGADDSRTTRRGGMTCVPPVESASPLSTPMVFLQRYYATGFSAGAIKA